MKEQIRIGILGYGNLGKGVECAIKQKMIENSRAKYYLCDKSKIGRVGFVKLAPFDKIDYFITDTDLSDAWKEKFEEMKVEIIKAEE